MKICFRYGRDGTAEPQLDLGAMTLLVGPNSSGKSLALREICSITRSQSLNSVSGAGGKTVSIAHVHATDPRSAAQERWSSRILNRITQCLKSLEDDTLDIYGHNADTRVLVQSYASHGLPIEVRHNPDSRQIATRQLKARLESFDNEEASTHDRYRAIASKLLDDELVRTWDFASLVVQHSTLESRFQALSPQDAHSPRNAPKNNLMALLQRPDALARVNDLLGKLGGFQIAVDASEMTSLRVISYPQGATPPPACAPWEPESLAYFSRAEALDERSSGQRLLAAVVVEAEMSDCDLLLLDEPELSLHPPLAHQLGALYTQLAEERGSHVVAATHSPAFVAGCLSTQLPVSICRLDYRGGKGSAKVLRPEVVRSMVSRPKLRAANTLGALFHKVAIICEGPPDRLIYSDINERLLIAERGTYPFAMADCQFLEYGGMTGIPEPLEMLREAGVRVAVLVDLDIIFNSPLYKKLMQTLGHDKMTIKGELEKRAKIAAYFPKGKEDFPFSLESRSPEEQAYFRDWMDELGALGVFPAEQGELEDWLQGLEIPYGRSEKSKWTPAILEKLGPLDASPYKPHEGDIWGYMRRVAAWLDLPPEHVFPANSDAETQQDNE